MGNTSEELKEIKKRAKDKEKAADTRYHLVRFKRGEQVRAGWLGSGPRVFFTPERVERFLAERREREAGRCYTAAWFMYLGPKPNPKWGPVCP